MITDPNAKIDESSGVYRRWLHLFMMKRWPDGNLSVFQGPIEYVDPHMSYPWVFEGDVPCFESLTALWHITGFEGQPEAWRSFWYDVRAMRRHVVDSTEHTYGPLWMINERASVASVAQHMVGRKNAARTKLFREHSVKNLAQQTGDMLKSELRPFLITNLGEEFDETERPDQVRSRAVQHGYGPPPNRPPGGRQV